MLKISACVIMRDEEKNITRCLTSLHDNVDEIIVVDTGSVDNSIQLARKYTDKIYTYHWKDDFAAAKNFALAKTTGDWIVFMDADEYFSADTCGNIAAVIKKNTANYDALKIARQDIDKRNDIMMSREFSLRIFRNERSLSYKGKIHEFIGYDDGRVLRVTNIDKTELMFFHTGYSQEKIKEKCLRNLDILLREMRKNSIRPYLNRYLADTYYGLSDYSKAAKYARREIKLNAPPILEASRPYRILYDSLRQLRAPRKQREKVLLQAIRVFPLLPDFYAEYALNLYQQGRYNKAVSYFLQAEKLSGSYCDENEFSLLVKSMPALYKIMGDLFMKLGDKKKAGYYQQKGNNIL